MSDFQKKNKLNNLTATQLNKFLKLMTEKSIVDKKINNDYGQCLEISYMQEGMWHYQNIYPDSTAYNVPFVIHIKGEIDYEKFNDAFQLVINNHPILKTSFHNIDNKIIQKINSEITYSVKYSEILYTNENNAELMNELEEVNRPFDLSFAPLFRMNLIKINEKQYILMFCIHHIIYDNWSLSILINELSTYYMKLKMDEICEVHPTHHFFQYAKNERKRYSESIIYENKQYWLNKLKHLQMFCQIPHIKFNKENGRKCKRKSNIITTSQIARIEKKCLTCECTMFMWLLCVFMCLMFVYTSSKYVVVSVPVTLRKTPEEQTTIGCFVDMLMLELEMNKETTFKKVLTNLQSEFEASYFDKYVPSHILLRELRKETKLDYDEMYQVMFNYISRVKLGSEDFDFKMDTFAIENKESKYELSLEAIDSKDGLILSIEYNISNLDELSIAMMLKDYCSLINIVIDNDEMILEDIYDIIVNQGDM